jgi:hypothetical protein
LEKTSSRLEKEKILSEQKDNVLLRELMLAAMDPFQTYGITKFKRQPPLPPDQSSPTPIMHYLALLKDLNARTYTGNDARDLVSQDFSHMTAVEQKWCERVLLKNLRCGASRETVNKVWPGLIPSFEVQLANEVKWKHTEAKDDFVITSKIDYPVYCDQKLDGHRLIVTKRDGVVVMYSRSGQLIETYPTIRAQLEGISWDNFMLDGEVLSAGPDGWNDAQSVGFSTVNKKDDSKMVYNVFDYLPIQEWEEQACTRTYYERRTGLETLEEAKLANVQVVQGTLVHSEVELRAYYSECLDAGFEGIMLKDLESPYIFDRGDAVRKLKPWTSWEGIVVGAMEGNHNTKWEGMHSGGFIVRLPNGIDTRVGGGFKDDERKGFHSQIEKYGLEKSGYLGRVMEVKGQPPLSKDGRIRFPVFQRWREDGDVDQKVLALRATLNLV